jgi:hypothetical protein
MRQFATIVTAVTVFGAMAATAQADSINGGPLKQGNQCWTSSPMSTDKDSRWGYWGACPQSASASVATTPTPRVTRRNRASR